MMQCTDHSGINRKHSTLYSQFLAAKVAAEEPSNLVMSVCACV